MLSCISLDVLTPLQVTVHMFSLALAVTGLAAAKLVKKAMPNFHIVVLNADRDAKVSPTLCFGLQQCVADQQPVQLCRLSLSLSASVGNASQRVIRKKSVGNSDESHCQSSVKYVA